MINLTDSNYIKSIPKMTLPAKYQQAFADLLNQLELETGQKFLTLELRGRGLDHPLKINTSDRPTKKYRVREMAKGYREIEGEYSTIGEIRKKITERRWSKFDRRDGYWRCPGCWRWNHVGNLSCEDLSCDYIHSSSKWDDIRIDKDSGTIWKMDRADQRESIGKLIIMK